MLEERDFKNSKNTFELEGNVGNIYDIYVNKNGKKILHFDLGQNNKGNTQFVPIVIKGELANTFGQDIKRGDWLTINGIINSYNKEIENDGKRYTNKVVEILGFDIKDRTNNKHYSSDGQFEELNKSNEREER